MNHKRKRLTNLDKCLWQQRCVDVAHSTLKYINGEEKKVLFALLNFRNFSVGEHEYFCLPFSIPFNLVDRFMPVLFSLFLPSIIITITKKCRIMRISKWIFFPFAFIRSVYLLSLHLPFECVSLDDISSFCSCCYRMSEGGNLSFLFSTSTLFTFLIWVPGN